jgi:hypothetical protein
MSIKLSKEFGLNPSLMICSLCGEGSGVALLGANKGKKAPGKILDREPCQKCKDYMKLGIILVEVDEEKSKGDLKNPYRTGRFFVVSEDFIRRAITDPSMKNDIMKRRVSFIPIEVTKMFGLDQATPTMQEGAA